MSNYASLFTGAGENDGNQFSAKKDSSSPYTLLFVDDEDNVLRALRRVFHHENYKIITACNGEQALEQLKDTPCQLMISDYMMPKMNGAQLLSAVKDQFPEVIRIMLTGHADTGAVMGAIKDGAVYKFILKPWNDDDLRVTVALALEQYELLRKNRELAQLSTEQSKEIQSLSKLAVTNRSQLAIMLHKKNLLNDKQVQELHKLQQTRKDPIIKIILSRDWVSEKNIRDILRKDLMIEEVDLKEFVIDPGIASLLPRGFCEKQCVLPLQEENRRLTLVMADPMDLGLIDDLRFMTGFEVQAVMANVLDIKDKLKEMHGGSDVSFDELEALVASDDPYEGIEVLLEEDDEASLEELLYGTDEPPAIRLVNAIILESVRLGASDIHIHPNSKSVVVRYRIDGVLHDKIQVPHALHLSLVSRIKVMAELDITERRRPQDGRLTVKTPMKIIDLRISALPTINGEKIVMRLLDRNSTVQALEELGMSVCNHTKIVNVARRPQGLILATGPTGSGKTTTLYSMLQYNATSEKNYVTIEDPVEYYLDMAGQVMIKEKIGLNFASVLRAILRQDPDVILLGEIRDYETAEVAFHAALTGHLVYSTLHTNSSIATIARLFDLGLKPYVVASGIEAIIAQRLVRKNCENCSERIKVSAQDMHLLGAKFASIEGECIRGRGCPKCGNSGYRGRVGLYEVLVPSEQLRHLISVNASVLDLSECAEREGIKSLLEDGVGKVAQGLTSTDEILRVLGTQVVL